MQHIFLIRTELDSPTALIGQERHEFFDEPDWFHRSTPQIIPFFFRVLKGKTGITVLYLAVKERHHINFLSFIETVDDVVD